MFRLTRADYVYVYRARANDSWIVLADHYSPESMGRGKETNKSVVVQWMSAGDDDEG